MPLDVHGCLACPHPGIGPAIQGSPDVNVNRRPALRVDDPGLHAACCGTNTWTAKQGSATVFINGKAAHRMGDQTRHCGGNGQLIEGSPNVIVGDSGGSGPVQAAAATRRTSRPDTPPQNDVVEGRSVANVKAHPGGATRSESDRVNPRNVTRDVYVTVTLADEKQLEVQLVNARGRPQPNIRFELKLPSGAVKIGASAQDGFIRISGLKENGEAQLFLPDIQGSRK